MSTNADETGKVEETEVDESKFPRLDLDELPELTGEQRVRLWDAVIGAIAFEDGARYDQSVWTFDGDKVVVFKESCGTAACIAGHAVHEAAALKLIPPCRVEMRSPSCVIAGAARILLGLDDETADRLFDEMLEPLAGRDMPSILREVRDLQVSGASAYDILERVNGLTELGGDYDG